VAVVDVAELTPKSEIITRLGSLKSERATWFLHWQEITAYLLPRNGRYFLQDHNKGWKRHNNIYDNTGTRALKTLGAGLMGGLTSPARPWFRLGTSDHDLMDYAPVKEWLAQCTRIMLDIFSRSNTYRALHQQYLELGAFGTASTIVLEDYERVIHHYPLTIGEYCIAQDWQGKVTTLYREFERTVAELVKEFGIDNVSPGRALDVRARQPRASGSRSCTRSSRAQTAIRLSAMHSTCPGARCTTSSAATR
jgi:hypothetical protein